MQTDFIKNLKVEKGPRSTIKIAGEIPFEVIETFRAQAIKDLGKDVELKGFRKGHVPEKTLIQHIGELTILNEMAERALANVYPKILEEHKVDAIGRPHVHTTKLAPGNPFGFTLEIAVMPEVTLPDYKKVAGEINKEREVATVSEKDLADGIERIQRQKMTYDRIQEKARIRQAAEEAAKDGLTLPTPETTTNEKEEDFSKLPVPPLTDEYVKGLGAFESVDAFKRQIREHLEKEKMEEMQSKHRGALTEALIGGSTIDLPEILIQSEINQISAQMEDDLKRAGLTVEGYLEHMKKTKEDMVKEWTPTAETRAKTQLILNEIAKREKIEPNKDDVVRDMGNLMAQFKDADPVRVRIYVESVLRNNEVMKFLESQ